MATTALKTRGKGKRTQYREAKLRAGSLVDNLRADGRLSLSAYDMIGESLNVMGECLGVFIEHARSISATDPAKTAERLDAYGLAVDTAAKLAPYRYPKYATLKIGTDDRDQPLVGDDESYDELMADLVEHLKRTGKRPSKMIDVSPKPGVGNR
jgi:hypothetical protein